MNIRDTFGTRITELRNALGLTQGELAEKLGISRQSVTLYENKTRIPDIEVLGRFATFFNVTSDYLLGLTNTKTADTDLKAVCEYTGLNEKSVEMIKRITDHSLPQTHITDLQKSMNFLMGSSRFASFIMQIAIITRRKECLENAITDFKNKLIEYEDNPPEDIISYAARLSVNEMSCVHREAENVMIENDRVNYSLFCLQNLMKKIVDEYTVDDKTSNNHNIK